MKLPHANLAVVDREKITEYLLNREHPDNGGKADFFIVLGFTMDKWENLADALQQLAIRSEVSLSMESPHGKKYMLMAKLKLLLARLQSFERFGSLIEKNRLLGW